MIAVKTMNNMPVVYHFGIREVEDALKNPLSNPSTNNYLWKQYFRRIRKYKDSVPVRFLTKNQYDFFFLLNHQQHISPAQMTIHEDAHKITGNFEATLPSGFMWGYKDKNGLWDFYFGINMSFTCNSKVRPADANKKTYFFSDIYKFPDVNGSVTRVSTYPWVPLPVENNIREFYGRLR